MAPRTRSNRVELLARAKLLASGQALNTNGFPALPDELYLEIISYLPSIPVPTENRKIDNKALRCRQLTLSSLSQTCQSLRRVFLKYLWQRIEVFEGMETGKGILPLIDALAPRFENHGLRKYAEELVRQLEIVTVRDPSLATHVNILNVVVTKYSVETVLVELARCMSLFPNLHTVQLLFRFFRFNPLKIFEPYQFPQILNVCLSPSSAFILAACPRVVCVTPSPYIHRNNSHELLRATIEHCPNLKVLGSCDIGLDDCTKIVKHFKNLCDITLNPVSLRFGYQNIQPLSELPHLHTIRIRLIDLGAHRRGIDSTEQIQWVQWARKILLACPKSETGNKKKIVVYDATGVIQVIHISTQVPIS